MSRSEPEHVVHSWDEAVRVGAEELGMDEAELRAEIEALTFRPVDGDESRSTADTDD